MGDPDTKAKHSSKRKRNHLAKELWENKVYRKKVHISEKDRDKQRQWRLKNDPEGDYDNVDDFIMRDR